MMSWLLFLSAIDWVVFASSPTSVTTSDLLWVQIELLPASILDKSRISLINMRRCLPARTMRPTGSENVHHALPALPHASISAMPMMALRGVRSSWLIFARNWLFVRFAASASLRACSKLDLTALPAR